MAKQDNLNDQDVYKQGIYAREELSTTGIGEGIISGLVWRRLY